MRHLLLLAALTACTQRFEPRPYHALDGDTISVGAGPHIRLARIDAPELPGHCRPGRHCVPGDPYTARALLQALLREDIHCTPGISDFYGRRLAECYLRDGRNISDLMLQSGLVEEYRR